MNTKRGRPKGSKNKKDPPGFKRAREFEKLKEKGLRPAVAAEMVANEHDVDVTTIFSDARRHDSRLAETIAAECRKIEGELRLRAANLVPRSELVAAFAEAKILIVECVGSRLSDRALAWAMGEIGDAEEARGRLSRVVADIKLELHFRFTERANELDKGAPALACGKYPMSNGAAMVFRALAEALKPNMD
ncbi:MAG: hypothetical protein FJY34_10655 [Betaproteobacteria bacterium]|nr:hypothetical protein [Betaproteobacteria bacterium]